MKNMVLILSLLSFLLSCSISCTRSIRPKVSQFGRYQGHSQAIYDGYERRSQYLTLGDGTRLAYDLYLPTKDGVPADDPMPTLFKYTPYLRTFTIFDADGNFLLGERCDGNIGMFGDSWQAMIQFAAASTGNPHLKAILQISSSLDSYSAVNGSYDDHQR